MTEEIIKCKYFVKEYEDFTNVCELGVIGKDGSFMACEYNPDCYYKQLKRLEFELKITKADYEASEQENKELLETLTKGCYQNLQHECRIWELKESKYRSALKEIRILATKNVSIENFVKIQNKINEVMNDN